MIQQYIALHKCRGEASFDCVTHVSDDDGGIWVTNTGHRAYPYEIWKIGESLGEWHGLELNYNFDGYCKDEPDMFQPAGVRPPSNFNVMEAISGLLPKIRRRV